MVPLPDERTARREQAAVLAVVETFLLESLVSREEWARRYADHPAATVVADAVQITAVLTASAGEAENPGFTRVRGV